MCVYFFIHRAQVTAHKMNLLRYTYIYNWENWILFQPKVSRTWVHQWFREYAIFDFVSAIYDSDSLFEQMYSTKCIVSPPLLRCIFHLFYTMQLLCTLNSVHDYNNLLLIWFLELSDTWWCFFLLLCGGGKFYAFSSIQSHGNDVTQTTP